MTIGWHMRRRCAVNWCPALGTVLANEEVVGGVSERGGHPVIRKPMRQWMLRITKYAERLLEDLAEVDWPESIKKLQTTGLAKVSARKSISRSMVSNENDSRFYNPARYAFRRDIYGSCAGASACRCDND